MSAFTQINHGITVFGRLFAINLLVLKYLESTESGGDTLFFQKTAGKH